MMFYSHLLVATCLIGWAMSCQTDEACNLNGLCTSGACVCDPGWRGADCGALDLRPAPRRNGYNLTAHGTSSWGSKIVQDPRNASLYHAFVAEFTHGCGLDFWNPYSRIVRAESRSGPLGPYTFAAAIVSPFAHNPTVIYSPADRQYLLYYIGCAQNVSANVCAQFDFSCGPGNGVDGESGISVQSSPDLRTWTPRGQVFPGLTSDAWDADTTNPSPLALYNGSSDARTTTAEILLAYRGCPTNCSGGAEQIGLATAPHYTGPYARLDAAAPNPIFANASEDPFVWRDHRGNFHLLVHSLEADGGFGNGPKVGRHAFARDIRGPWTFNSRTLAFSTQVAFADGTVVDYFRRERPQLFFDNTGRPVVLTTGVQEQGSQMSYSLMVPVGGSS